MKRRQFIARLAGAAACPLVARAQQRADRVRRIGMLLVGDENDPEWKLRYSAFTQAFAGLGWIDGRDVQMDLRWAGGEINRIRAIAQELVGLQLDLIVTDSTPATAIDDDDDDADSAGEQHRRHGLTDQTFPS
jgi:putative ABC transport system substrate-binding protein